MILYEKQYRGLRYKLGRFGKAYYWNGLDWVASTLGWSEINRGCRVDRYHELKRDEWKRREAERKAAKRWMQ